MFDLPRDGRGNLTKDKCDTLRSSPSTTASQDGVAALLARGADQARVNDRGRTALAAATFRCSASAVRVLLGAGVDPGLGRQSAVARAGVFELPHVLDLLRSGRPA